MRYAVIFGGVLDMEGIPKHLLTRYRQAEDKFSEAAISVYTEYLRIVYRELNKAHLEMTAELKVGFEKGLRELLLKMNPNCYLVSWDTDTDEIIVGVGDFHYKLSLVDKGQDEQEAICTSLQ